MTVRYSVTFEFDSAAPITHRGTVAASTMPTCFARAARSAARAHPSLHWSSMVVVLLERVPDATEASTARPAVGRLVGDKGGTNPVRLEPSHATTHGGDADSR